jgi:PKHD-type hydroxylase
MNFHLPTVLDTESLRALRALLTSAQYADGASTAGWHARPVKRNE